MKRVKVGFCLMLLPVMLFMSQIAFGRTLKDWATIAYSAETVEDSIRYYTEALRAYPTEELFYFFRGKVKEHQGDWDGVIEDSTKAIELCPRMAAAYNLRGQAKEAKGDIEGAKKDFAKAKEEQALGDYRLYRLNRELKADPQNVGLYLKRADYKKDHGDYMGAIKDFDKYIELSGGAYMNAYWYRANAKKAIGDIEGAMADYSLVIEKFPGTRSFFYKKRARFKKSLGDLEGANADLEQAKLAHREQLNREIQSFTQVLEKNPLDVNALTDRGIRRMELKDYTGAIKDLDKAIEINPAAASRANTYYFRSQVETELKKSQKGKP